jgi:HJR/Mrr/RecB family endonuclease
MQLQSTLQSYSQTFLRRSHVIPITSLHESNLRVRLAPQDFRALKGSEFESYVAQLLSGAGYTVTGTRATGDQGADLIAKKDGLTIAVQAKRYAGPVGNGAVQEIVAALRYYNADEGWVTTNSTFTRSARDLAHANKIRLIDGNDLKDLFRTLGHLPHRPSRQTLLKQSNERIQGPLSSFTISRRANS